MERTLEHSNTNMPSVNQIVLTYTDKLVIYKPQRPKKAGDESLKHNKLIPTPFAKANDRANKEFVVACRGQTTLIAKRSRPYVSVEASASGYYKGRFLFFKQITYANNKTEKRRVFG